jgi:hypothetical protein
LAQGSKSAIRRMPFGVGHGLLKGGKRVYRSFTAHSTARSELVKEAAKPN